MGEYIGRINVPKDTMLFIVNDIFHKNIKESTTKENILKIIPELYQEENLLELIKILPYESYLALEKLIEYAKNNEDITEYERKMDHVGIRYLEEAMIIIMRAKDREYRYSLNPGVIENLTILFNEENRELAQRYGEIEKLTEGILYTYGVVKYDFLRTAICKYRNEIISQDELEDIYFKRLNLNLFINHYTIRWTNTNQRETFVTYLEEEEVDIGNIAAEQKSRDFQYKNVSEKEILQRQEYQWDDRTQKLYKFIKATNDNLWEFKFQKIIKKNELGKDILGELSNMCTFKEDKELKEFIDLFMDWHNNSPQYLLGGYSPNEFRRLE